MSSYSQEPGFADQTLSMIYKVSCRKPLRVDSTADFLRTQINRALDQHPNQRIAALKNQFLQDDFPCCSTTPATSAFMNELFALRTLVKSSVSSSQIDT